MQFVDTNVLLYSVSKTPEEEVKAQVAREILRRRDLALSAQVLQEFYVQATRLVESFCRYAVQELTLPIVKAAFVTRARWKLSYWDAAILEAARSSGCETVLSEDLSHGESYDGIQVENPFREKG